MEEKQQKHIIDIFFVITLFCLFALSAIFLISIGADIYGKTVNNMEQNFDTRTALAYITEKVRQSDQQDQLSVGNLDGHPALIISSHTTSSDYQTYLYAYDGQLKELMVKQGVTLGPETGQNILAVSDFDLHLEGENLISCTIEIDETHSYDLFISTHAGGIDVEE